MRRAVAIGCLAVVLVGCAGGRAGPGSVRPARGTTTPSRVAEAQRTHEYPSSRPPAERTTGSPTALAAVRRFAAAYVNWSYGTVAADLYRLAATSVGQARSAMTLAAAQTAGDYELQRGQISNRGTVEAVAPLTGHRDEYVVVTEEATTAAATTVYQGLQPAWHVALATVVRQSDGGYAVSAWQPQS